ncbi:hypothetical protein FRB97_001042 [Tulasnella sp. 331]|nr:hypothetical protein FRB97_001042 [Tulasnella sp. 331]
MSSTNTVPATSVAFTFPKVEGNGLILDPNGNIAYQLYTRSDISNAPTMVSRANGQLVGEIAWNGATHERAVTLYGIKTRSLVARRNGRLFEGGEWIFQDAIGNEYTWDKLSCRTSDGRLVAQYSEAEPHLTKKDKPATLSVEQQFFPMLDIILFTCLEVTKAKESFVDIVANIGGF